MITNGYTTLAKLKSQSGLDLLSADQDVILEEVIEAVSRAIDNYCGRKFYLTSENRYYTPQDGTTLYVDDIGSTSSLSVYTDEDGDGTFEVTWAATDFNAAPYNALSNGEAFNMIETAPGGSYSFPTVNRSTKIFAFFGFPVPKPIAAACLLWSERLFKRYAAPLGTASMSALGEIRLTVNQFDPDVKQLLDAYVRWA